MDAFATLSLLSDQELVFEFVEDPSLAYVGGGATVTNAI